MEQILRSHGGEQEGGMRTLDRGQEEAGVRQEAPGARHVRRQHKRSILKPEGRRSQSSQPAEPGGEGRAARETRGGSGAKVKFAGSLRGGRGDYSHRARARVVLRGPAYLLQLPWGYQQPVYQPHQLYSQQYELQQHNRL
jgi:hypothetical protein